MSGAMERIERVEPGPGQESVWDYPRPPVVERGRKHLLVVSGGVVIADTTSALKVMETASPPTYYVPPEDVRVELLRPSGGRHTFCEWKGRASYFDVIVGERTSAEAAWTYERPTERYVELAGHLAFYPSRVDCTLDGEPVRPQGGGFYGGWVTDDVVGPWKGGPGTGGW
jgi:uncharacterized protein (DUF427 family)